jgi:hypothetical protein
MKVFLWLIVAAVIIAVCCTNVRVINMNGIIINILPITVPLEK